MSEPKDDQRKGIFATIISRIRSLREWRNEEYKSFKAEEILPAWFVPRMMYDSSWYFGLLTTSGSVIQIETIDNIYQDKNGGIWIDVILLDEPVANSERLGKPIVAPTTERREATINVAHIIAAFELYD